MGPVPEKISSILDLPLKSIPCTVRECHRYRTKYEIIINGGQYIVAFTPSFTNNFCLGVCNYFLQIILVWITLIAWKGASLLGYGDSFY